MIDQRLFDHYGIDTAKDLQITKRCARPFDTILIDKKGSCYACECQSWLPQSIGNLQVRSLHEIIDGDIRRNLQSSINDGSYRYCNEHRCSYIRGGLINSSGDEIKHLRLAIDDSCNLRCPSCRKSMIFHKQGGAYNLGVRLADRVNEWLNSHKKSIQVHLGSDGDPFASHVYRHFMSKTPKRNDIKYSILTNALMLKEFSPRVPYVIKNLKELGVSMDGASAGTYEKLRLGGKWEKINENLQYISQLKDKHGFRFVIHYVVQKDNYHEMRDIVLLGEKYNADRIWFSRIQNWNTWDNFDEHNIFDQKHPQHQHYREHLTKLVDMNSSIVEEATLTQLH
jgi:sulfatase maturation enzyme AslB (radical SAM superfamily)